MPPSSVPIWCYYSVELCHPWSCLLLKARLAAGSEDGEESYPEALSAMEQILLQPSQFE